MIKHEINPTPTIPGFQLALPTPQESVPIHITLPDQIRPHGAPGVVFLDAEDMHVPVHLPGVGILEREQGGAVAEDLGGGCVKGFVEGVCVGGMGLGEVVDMLQIYKLASFLLEGKNQIQSLTYLQFSLKDVDQPVQLPRWVLHQQRVRAAGF